jgi:hypothetical protein
MTCPLHGDVPNCSVTHFCASLALFAFDPLISDKRVNLLPLSFYFVLNYFTRKQSRVQLLFVSCTLWLGHHWLRCSPFSLLGVWQARKGQGPAFHRILWWWVPKEPWAICGVPLLLLVSSSSSSSPSHRQCISGLQVFYLPFPVTLPSVFSIVDITRWCASQSWIIRSGPLAETSSRILTLLPMPHHYI